MHCYRTRNVSSNFGCTHCCEICNHQSRLLTEYSSHRPRFFFGRNELLTQYPELADELEEEIKRMEEENSEKQAYVEDLENQISNDETDAIPEVPATAFVRGGEKVGGNENYDSVVNEEVENDELVMSQEVPIDEPMDDFIPAEDGETLPTATEEHVEELPTSDSNPDVTQMEEDIDADANTTTNAGTNMESPDTTADKEDLTLPHLAIESLRVLVKNAQEDVKRIINLAIPVLQPLLNAGDVAWRQMKSLILRAREVYEAYQATNNSPSEGTEVAEVYDDSTSA